MGAVLVWLLWVANAVNDLLPRGGPSSFTLVMLAALLGGQVLVWLGVVRSPMPRKWALVTMGVVGIVILGFAAYTLARLLLHA